MNSPVPVPHAVSWNLTQRCNLRCAHCYLAASQRSKPQPDELSRSECLKLVDELATLNPHLVLILTGGEPLLQPHLGEIVERAALAGMTPVLGTNGTRIRPQLARDLHARGLRGWGVSIDSTDPDAHDRIRGVRGAWHRTLEGLRVLRDLGLPFVVQPSIFSWNRHEIPALARLALELGAEGVNFYFLVCTGRGQGVTDISAEDYEQALQEITRLQEEMQGRLRVHAKCAPHQKRLVHDRDAGSEYLAGYAGGCPAATHYFRIGPVGDVSPCPYIPPAGASTRQQTLSEIWAHDAQFVSLRDRASLKGRCGRCEYREICGGCRARAQALTGDPLSEDPSCSYLPGSGVRPELSPECTFGGELRFALPWTAEARSRLEAIPSFLTSMVIARVEAAARETGESEVTVALMKRVRGRAAPLFSSGNGSGSKPG